MEKIKLITVTIHHVRDTTRPGAPIIPDRDILVTPSSILFVKPYQTPADYQVYFDNGSGLSTIEGKIFYTTKKSYFEEIK